MTEILYIEHNCEPGKELAGLPMPRDVTRVTVRWGCPVCGQRWECVVGRVWDRGNADPYMEQGTRIGGPRRAWVTEQQRAMHSKAEPHLGGTTND